MKQVLKAYLECALWSSTDNSDDTGGEPLDANYSTEDFAPEALAQANKDISEFIELVGATVESSGISDVQVGHDFWLTRNGHGAGFWDRGLGEIGDKLSIWAKTFGSCDIYVGDDGKLYFA